MTCASVVDGIASFLMLIKFLTLSDVVVVLLFGVFCVWLVRMFCRYSTQVESLSLASVFFLEGQVYNNCD